MAVSVPRRYFVRVFTHCFGNILEALPLWKASWIAMGGQRCKKQNSRINSVLVCIALIQ